MANTYFRFKQFRIDQDKCAMKVCTDSCLFGALLPVSNATRILDIGTGTGLLSLMAAQRNAHAIIDAVEIDAEAAEQAQQNFNASPWANRLNLYSTALQDFRPVLGTTYDLIITNPPFFLNSLTPASGKELTARHTHKLSYEEILNFAAAYITQNGLLSVLLPPYEQTVFEQLAHNFGFFNHSKIDVKDRPETAIIRTIQNYTKVKAENVPASMLTIRDEKGQYTTEFEEVLKDFYLAF